MNLLTAKTMVEVRLFCEDEIKAYELTSYAVLNKMAVQAKVVVDKKAKNISIEDGKMTSFINEKHHGLSTEGSRGAVTR